MARCGVRRPRVECACAREVPLAPTMRLRLSRDTGAVQCDSSAVLAELPPWYRHTLCQRGAQFSGLLWPSAEACVECASAEYP